MMTMEDFEARIRANDPDKAEQEIATFRRHQEQLNKTDKRAAILDQLTGQTDDDMNLLREGLTDVGVDTPDAIIYEEEE